MVIVAFTLPFIGKFRAVAANVSIADIIRDGCQALPRSVNDEQN